jgi:hypothetical protein
MSVKGDVQEIAEIDLELKRLNSRARELRRLRKIATERIVEFLEEQDQPGVKYQGTAVVLNNQVRRGVKPAKDREADAIDVLRNHGIDNAREVLEELLEARKGAEVANRKITIKRI